MYRKLSCFVSVMLLLSFQWSFAQTKTILGKVTDDQNSPMPGVAVTVKGTTKGVVTDFDGNYSIEAQSGQVLVFSFVGFSTENVVVDKGGGNQKKVNVKLKVSTQQLDEVVVVGFGKQKKENLTGAVSSVDSKTLENRPVSNVTQALQGAVPGMNFSVNNGGGELNNSLSFNIRGGGTIGNTSSSPLVLIDGMEGDINSLNPQDIESISVLKDAAASSIYGSRAAFGVVLIKTKSGKEGRISISYNHNLRVNTPLLQPKMLDSERFAHYWNDAAVNGGIDKPFSDEILQKIVDYKNGKLKANDVSTWNSEKGEWNNYMRSWANVNWYKQLYQQSAPSYEHNLNVRGGTEKLNFYLSGSWLNQEGLLRYNTDSFDKKSVVGNIKAKINDKIQLTYKTQFTRIGYERPFWASGLFYHNIARRWPTLPVYDPNGKLFNGNEISHLEGGNVREQNDELVQQGSLVITPVKNWNINAELNYKVNDNDTHSFAREIFRYGKNGKPILVAYGGLGLSNPGQTFVSDTHYRTNYYNINLYSDYVFSLREMHNFKILGGFQVEALERSNFSAKRDGLYTPKILVINGTGGENDDVSGARNIWRTAGFFGRLNYNYDSRYLLEVNLRYDGTSRYLRDQRWNLFTSGSLGWNITKEKFWTSLGGFADKFNTLKPRVSYGELGNQNTNSWYPFYQTISVSANNGNWLIDNKRTNTAYAPGLVSALLTWERVSTVNYGLDVNMFSNRLSFVFDYFVRKTKDMVGPSPELPATLGTAVPKYNNTDMESRGFELEVGWNDRLSNGFGYSAKLSLTDNYQVVTNYPNETGALSNWYNGKRSGEIWGYTTIGIAKTQAEMEAHLSKVDQSRLGTNWGAGDIMYADLNGDGKIDNGAGTLSDHGDLSLIGNSTPRYNFGLDVAADYEGIDFRVFFQGTMKRDLAVGGPYFQGANSNRWQNAGFEEHLDYFRPEDTNSFFGPNVDSYFPRPIENGGGKNFAQQTRWLQNGAYVRLKSIQLGYTLPQHITQRIGITKLRLYVAGENIWTYTKLIKIFDPETFVGAWGNGKIYPLSKVYSIGLNVNF